MILFLLDAVDGWAVIPIMVVIAVIVDTVTVLVGTRVDTVVEIIAVCGRRDIPSTSRKGALVAAIVAISSPR